jgi:hypothetical protein
LHEIAGMVAKSPTVEFLLEALSTLANLASPDASYAELLSKHGLLDVLIKNLMPGFAEDDVVLAAIMTIGTLAIDSKAAMLLANERLVRLVADVLHDKQEDEDLLLQTLFAVFKLLVHNESRAAVTRNQALCDSLLDMVADPNAEIQRFANMCLDVIMDGDSASRDRLRERRFVAYNGEWLTATDRLARGALAVPRGGGGGETLSPMSGGSRMDASGYGYEEDMDALEADEEEAAAAEEAARRAIDAAGRLDMGDSVDDGASDGDMGDGRGVSERGRGDVAAYAAVRAQQGRMGARLGRGELSAYN